MPSNGPSRGSRPVRDAATSWCRRAKLLHGRSSRGWPMDSQRRVEPGRPVLRSSRGGRRPEPGRRPRRIPPRDTTTFSDKAGHLIGSTDRAFPALFRSPRTSDVAVDRRCDPPPLDALRGSIPTEARHRRPGSGGRAAVGGQRCAGTDIFLGRWPPLPRSCTGSTVPGHDATERATNLACLPRERSSTRIGDSE